jgi:hypothetical protein
VYFNPIEGGFILSQTIQSSSWASLSEAGKDLTIPKHETEDNISLLLQVFDSLNDLCEKLNRLNYLLQRKNMENILIQKARDKQNENQD